MFGGSGNRVMFAGLPRPHSSVAQLREHRSFTTVRPTGGALARGETLSLRAYFFYSNH